MWWSLVACLTDPLASVGLEPTAPRAEEALPEPKELVIPTTPPMDGAKITGEGSQPEAAPSQGGASATAGEVPPPVEYNPISIPQGPRQSGGVKWEGVSKRGSNAPLREANGSAEYEESLN
jgi:hypothetical protein